MFKLQTKTVIMATNTKTNVQCYEILLSKMPEFPVVEVFASGFIMKAALLLRKLPVQLHFAKKEGVNHGARTPVSVSSFR